MSWHRFFAWLLARRALVGLALLALCMLAAQEAARVPVDPSVERMHPLKAQARVDFERYRRAFPGEDAQVFVIAEGPTVFTPEGLATLERLEKALKVLPRVRHVVGLLSVPSTEGNLFPERVRNSTEAIRKSVERARQEPLSRLLVHPTRELTVVQVGLRTGAGAARIAAEREFTAEAKALLARHAQPGLRLTLTGPPAVRATMGLMVEEDMGRLLPLALLVILALVAVAYRDVWSVLATAATLLVAWLWMMGALGALQVPLGVLTSFSPIVILVVSLTDTVHVLSDLEARCREGTPWRRALEEAMAAAAGPCLATELVIAAGFLSMRFIGITAVYEFGLATALGVLLAWGANMLVLPWVLSLRPQRSAARAWRQLRAERAQPLEGMLRWVQRQVVNHPVVVGLVAAVVVGLSLASMTRLKREFRVFDDLRPDSPLAAELAYAEQALGGLVPLAVFVEAESGKENATLEPEAMAFQERVHAFLEGLPEQPPVVSVPRLVVPVREALKDNLWVAVETYPKTLKLLEAYMPAVDVVASKDRRSSGVVALLPDSGSARMHTLVESTRAFVAREVPPGYRAVVTGNLAMTEYVTSLLTQGLLESFIAAIGVTLLAFLLVLRSVKLALIGLVPNVLPMAVLFGAMPLLGIALKPSTVIIASMVLVIADDDTLQYLVRYKRRYLALRAEGEAEPHRRAALETLSECGRAMFVTSAAVGGGFLLLLLSRFEGIAHLGLLTGLTLWVAGLADAFLSPVLLMALKPELRAPASKLRVEADVHVVVVVLGDAAAVLHQQPAAAVVVVDALLPDDVPDAVGAPLGQGDVRHLVAQGIVVARVAPVRGGRQDVQGPVGGGVVAGVRGDAARPRGAARGIREGLDVRQHRRPAHRHRAEQVEVGARGPARRGAVPHVVEAIRRAGLHQRDPGPQGHRQDDAEGGAGPGAQVQVVVRHQRGPDRIAPRNGLGYHSGLSGGMLMLVLMPTDKLLDLERRRYIRLTTPRQQQYGSCKARGHIRTEHVHPP